MNELCFMEPCQEGPRTMERDRDNQLWVHEPVVGVYFQQRSKLLPSTPQFQQLLKPGRRLSRTGKCVCHRMSVKNPPICRLLPATDSDRVCMYRLLPGCGVYVKDLLRSAPGQAEPSPIRLEQLTASPSCQQEQVGLFYQFRSTPPPPGCPECRQQTT